MMTCMCDVHDDVHGDVHGDVQVSDCETQVSDMHPALHDPQELKKVAAILKVGAGAAGGGGGGGDHDVIYRVDACAGCDACVTRT